MSIVQCFRQTTQPCLGLGRHGLVFAGEGLVLSRLQVFDRITTKKVVGRHVEGPGQTGKLLRRRARKIPVQYCKPNDIVGSAAAPVTTELMAPRQRRAERTKKSAAWILVFEARLSTARQAQVRIPPSHAFAASAIPAQVSFVSFAAVLFNLDCIRLTRPGDVQR